MELCYILPSPPPSSRDSDYESDCPLVLLQCWFTTGRVNEKSPVYCLPGGPAQVCLGLLLQSVATPYAKRWEELGDGRGTKAKNDRKTEGYQI